MQRESENRTTKEMEQERKRVKKNDGIRMREKEGNRENYG
jgi:hypothetical protein